MATKRGSSNVGIHMSSRGVGGGSRLPVASLVFFSVLAPLLFFVGRGLHSTTATHSHDVSTANKENVEWRERLASLQHVKSLLSKEDIDAITSSTNDVGPFSLDYIRKNNLSASWKAGVVETFAKNHLTLVEPNPNATDVRQETPRSKQGDSSDEHSHFIDTPATRARKQLREKRWVKRAAELVQRNDEAIVKLENAAIERSKSVDSSVLGKYNIWRESENENSDLTVRLMRDQIIMARVYLSIAKMKNKLELYQELQTRLKESQRSLGEATADADLHRSAPGKIRTMGQVLSKAREQLYDCKLVTGKLRAMLQSADEQVRSLKKQSTFLSQLAAKTVPNGIHFLSLLLTIDYHLLPPEKRKFHRSENLEDPGLYHYALFSDNVLAAAVVVNSTIRNAKNEERTLWKLGTLPPGLITFYGLTHPVEKSWHVLGLGYNPSVDRAEIENAAVLHYNGNLKPWLELAMSKYRSYWTKYLKYGDSYLHRCNLNE